MRVIQNGIKCVAESDSFSFVPHPIRLRVEYQNIFIDLMQRNIKNERGQYSISKYANAGFSLVKFRSGSVWWFFFILLNDQWYVMHIRNSGIIKTSCSKFTNKIVLENTKLHM